MSHTGNVLKPQPILSGAKRKYFHVALRRVPRPGEEGLPVRLVRGRGRVSKAIARLVAGAFLGPCPTGMEVDHIDPLHKGNNAVSNLRYLSHEANVAAAVQQGLRYQPRFDEDDLRGMRILRASGFPLRLIAAFFRCPFSTCYNLLNGTNRVRPATDK